MQTVQKLLMASYFSTFCTRCLIMFLFCRTGHVLYWIYISGEKVLMFQGSDEQWFWWSSEVLIIRGSVLVQFVSEAASSSTISGSTGTCCQRSALPVRSLRSSSSLTQEVKRWVKGRHEQRTEHLNAAAASLSVFLLHSNLIQEMWAL